MTGLTAARGPLRLRPPGTGPGDKRGDGGMTLSRTSGRWMLPWLIALAIAMLLPAAASAADWRDDLGANP
jgi:hypothetical protein